MTAYTSVIDGYWDDHDTWGTALPAQYPQNGDTVIIRHIVTVRADVEVGNADAGFNVDLDNVNSVLTIVPGLTDITFKMHGQIRIQRGIMTIGTEAVPIPSTRTVRLWMADGTRKINITGVGAPVPDGGAFECWGFPNYKCTLGSTSQRSQLFAAITHIDATPVSFRTTEDVNWTAGDSVWIGTGCDKTATPTTCEKIIIATKVSASVYTAIFVYDHAAGDFLVHGDRNIIIDGNAAANGFVINAVPFAANQNTCRLRLDWTRLLYGGTGFAYTAAAVGAYVDGAASLTHVSANKYRVTNCVFDSAGNNGLGGGIAIETNREIDDSDVMIHDNHFYGYKYCLCRTDAVLTGGRPGTYTHNNMTAINSGYFWYTSDCAANIHSKYDGLWYSGTDRTSGLCTVFQNGVPNEVTNFKLCNCYKVMYLAGTVATWFADNSVLFDGGFVYWCNSGTGPNGAFEFSDTKNSYQLEMNDVEFYNLKGGAVYWGMFHGRAQFDSCTFDLCNTFNQTNGYYAPFALLNSDYLSIDAYFKNCTFGMAAQNAKFGAFGLMTDYLSMGTKNTIRIVLDGCSIKEPTSFAWAGAGVATTNELGWVMLDTGRVLNTWKPKSMQNINNSLELINCKIYNSAGVDRFPTVYPNVTRLGVVVGGCELRDEATVVLDNTLGLLIHPFNAAERSHVTKAHPIRIPVTSGQTVTVKVSLRKNQTQGLAAGRKPRAHLFGCGIDTYSEMTNMLNTWEEQTLTGVADSTGTVNLWFSVMNEINEAASESPTAGFSPYDLGWLKVYVDGLSVTIT
jgi:hypothetical protein